MTLTILSVLKSGGEYDAGWVSKLMRACTRNLTIPHRFECLSDVEVPCQRIPLKHDWPGWWSKIEIFRPGVIQGPTLYLDLDTVIVGNIDRIADLPYDFAMTRNLNMGHWASSLAMWFIKSPSQVYQTFLENPEFHMREHSRSNASMGVNIGDQSFIYEVMDRKVKFLSDDVPGLIRSYARHCTAGVPEGTSIVAFGGINKPSTVSDKWVKEAWHA